MSNIIYFEQIKESAAELSQFENVEQLRATVGATIHYFNPAEWKVIQSILSCSVTVIGVCWARTEVIVGKSGVSRPTYHRALKKAEDIGLLERRQRNKLNGQRGSNFIIFRSPDTADDTADDTLKETGEHLVHKELEPEIPSVAFNNLNNLKDFKPDDIYISLDQKIINYGLKEIGKTSYIPANIVNQIKAEVTKRYKGYRFDADRNDIIRAVWEADEKFNECLKKAHPISNFGGFWATIFEQQLLERKTKRDNLIGTVSPFYSLMTKWEAADRRSWFVHYVLGGGRAI